MTFELETRYKINNLGSRERIEVGDDPDGLDVTEIVFITDDGERETPLNVTDEQLPLLIKALQRRCMDRGIFSFHDDLNKG